MHTQFYGKVYENKHWSIPKSLKHNNNSTKPQDLYNILFDFETINSESKHMHYPCWFYNDDIQQ